MLKRRPDWVHSKELLIGCTARSSYAMSWCSGCCTILCLLLASGGASVRGCECVGATVHCYTRSSSFVGRSGGVVDRERHSEGKTLRGKDTQRETHSDQTAYSEGAHTLIYPTPFFGQNLTFEYLVPDVLGAHASITSKPREEGCTILDHFVMPVQRLH